METYGIKLLTESAIGFVVTISEAISVLIGQLMTVKSLYIIFRKFH